MFCTVYTTVTITLFHLNNSTESLKYKYQNIYYIFVVNNCINLFYDHKLLTYHKFSLHQLVFPKYKVLATTLYQTKNISELITIFKRT